MFTRAYGGYTVALLVIGESEIFALFRPRRPHIRVSRSSETLLLFICNGERGGTPEPVADRWLQ